MTTKQKAFVVVPYPTRSVMSAESRARSWAHAFVYVHLYSDQCGDAGHGHERYSANYWDLVSA
jgi:hypothetical protein